MTAQTFRSLLVCDILPWRRFGGAMRCGLVADALAARGPVDLLVLSNGSYPVPDGTPFAKVQILHQRGLSGPPSVLEALPGGPAAGRIRRLRRQVLSEAAPWVRGTRYDVVWYSRERTWLKASGLTPAPSIVDVDDLEDVITRRWLDLGRTAEGGPLTAAARLAMTWDARYWVRTHPRTARAADVVVFASDHDRRRFGFANALTVPNTYARETSPGRRRGDGPATLLLQGALTWPPNEDAAIWLVERIAPLIRRTHPDLRIVLAGSPSDRVRALHAPPAVSVVGRVPDMAEHVAAADLVVVPLRVGGGTRIKILEAFAHDVPVVSTSVGAEGLDVTAGLHLELADTAEDFAGRCADLLADPHRRRLLATRAREFYDDRHRPEHAHRQVHRAVELATGGPLRAGRQVAEPPGRPLP